MQSVVQHRNFVDYDLHKCEHSSEDREHGRPDEIEEEVIPIQHAVVLIVKNHLDTKRGSPRRGPEHRELLRLLRDTTQYRNQDTGSHRHYSTRSTAGKLSRRPLNCCFENCFPIPIPALCSCAHARSHTHQWWVILCWFCSALWCSMSLHVYC